jgi:hypothetical protein
MRGKDKYGYDEYYKDEYTEPAPKSEAWLMVEKCLEYIQWFRNLCGAVVNKTEVQFFIVMLIAVNGVMMGAATFPAVKYNPEVSAVFDQIDEIFLIIFTVELVLQFTYQGMIGLFLDGWLVFDTLVIVTSWTFSEVQIVRAFRIFRALRLITRVKTMKEIVIGTCGV